MLYYMDIISDRTYRYFSRRRATVSTWHPKYYMSILCINLKIYKVGLFISKSTLKYTELVDFNNPYAIFFATVSRQKTKFLQFKNNLFDTLQTN